MTKYQKRAFFYASIVAMGGFIFGLDAALISGTVNYLIQEFSLTELQLGTVVSAPGLGVFVALPLAGWASNALGRKRTLQIIAALYLVSAVSSAFAPSYWTLVIARFLGGLAFSSITLASMYIGEIAPPSLRGKLVSMTQINIVIGLSAAYFINYLILQLTGSGAGWINVLGIKEHTWRYMLGSEIIFALIWFILLLLIPQSPAWLVYRNRIADAEKSLLKIAPPSLIPKLLSEMQRSLADTVENLSIGSQLKEIFSKEMRLIFVIALTIAIAQQSTGINAIMFYAPTVIEQIGFGTDAAFMQAIWFGLTSVIFTILALMIVDKLGRRPMIIWGMVWIVASLGLCSYGFNKANYSISEQAITEMTDIPDVEKLNTIVGNVYNSDLTFKKAVIEIIGAKEARNHSSILLQKATNMPAGLVLFGILSFIAAFHFSVGPLMWVLFSEIFPIALRGIAIPFFAIITSLVSYLIQKFFPWQLATIGGSNTFLFYAVTVSIGLIILYFTLPETKNMTIEEIQLAMKRNR